MSCWVQVGCGFEMTWVQVGIGYDLVLGTSWHDELHGYDLTGTLHSLVTQHALGKNLLGVQSLRCSASASLRLSLWVTHVTCDNGLAHSIVKSWLWPSLFVEMNLHFCLIFTYWKSCRHARLSEHNSLHTVTSDCGTAVCVLFTF